MSEYSGHAGVPTQLRNLEAALSNRSLMDAQNPSQLPDNYTPGPKDICCGRGKRNWNHSGNVAFRNLIQASVDRYLEAPNKTAKTSVVVSIVDDIRRSGAYFLKEDDAGRWYDIGDQQAREKVGHSLRDQVTAQKKNAADDNQRNKSPVPSTVSATAPQSMQPQALQPQAMHSSSMFASEFAALPPQVSYGGIETQQQPSQQRQHHHQGGGYEPQQSVKRAAWLQQQQSMAPHAFEAWSDDEEDVRRKSLATTAVLENFGRRPSWIEMSFGSTSTPSSSLRSAALRAAEALEAEGHHLGDSLNNIGASFSDAAQQEQDAVLGTNAEHWDAPRSSGMSMMSFGDSYNSDMDNGGFANVFRGSMSSRSSAAYRMSLSSRGSVASRMSSIRKSSVNWLTEKEHKDLLMLFESSPGRDEAHMYPGEGQSQRASALSAFAEIQRLEASGEIGMEDD